MGRKSIFEILEDRMNFQEEVQRIDELFNNRYVFNWSMCGLIDSVYLKWKYRKTTINVEDLFRSVNITNINTIRSIDKYLIYCEVVANLIFVFYKYADSTWKDSKDISNITFSIIDNVKNGLNKVGYKLYVYDDNEHLIVVENNPLAVEASEMASDKTISVKIMEYNRYLLKGDLGGKRDILINLAKYFEGIRPKLKAYSLTGLDDDIGFLLNTFDIRHENKKGRIKNNLLETMSEDELEKWYDKTYHLIIAAINDIERIEIGQEIKELKKKVEAANKETK